MAFAEILAALEQAYPGKISGYEKFGSRLVVADKDVLKDVLTTMRDAYGFNYLVDIVASHWPKRQEKFEVSYNLFSIPNKLRVLVKARLVEPKAESVVDLWKSADYLEREQYDLMGVVFTGHPNLKRILLPDFFEGHPLRKDYKLKDRAWFNKMDEQQLGISFKNIGE